MTFRYKVRGQHKTIYNPHERYEVEIQLYNPYSRLFKWGTKCKLRLETIIYELNPDKFTNIKYMWEIKTKHIYQVLQDYKSMDDVIMKYITDVILRREKNNIKEAQQDEWVKNFVLTKDWKTIEIKEDK